MWVRFPQRPSQYKLYRKTMVIPSENDRNSNPLDTLIDFAWSSGADVFWVNNAKDELKRLKKELASLKDSLDQPVAYAKITEDGMLYDLNRQNNPYSDQTKVIPLYTPYRTKHG